MQEIYNEFGKCLTVNNIDTMNGSSSPKQANET